MNEVPIREMNDYAMTKWVGEMQVLNATELHGTETVRVRLFNIYVSGEHYSPYRSAICIFCYNSLRGRPYKVYQHHHRTLLFISDVIRTLSNIADRFNPIAVYNIGDGEYHDMKTVSDMVLDYPGQTSDLAELVEVEPQTTRDKKIDTAPAVWDLDNALVVPFPAVMPQSTERMR